MTGCTMHDLLEKLVFIEPVPKALVRRGCELVQFELKAALGTVTSLPATVVPLVTLFATFCHLKAVHAV